MKKLFFLLVINILCGIFHSKLAYGLEGDRQALHVHDPSVIRVGDTTYAFSTGWAEPIRVSKTVDTTMYSGWIQLGYAPVTTRAIPSWIGPLFTAKGLNIPDNLWSPDINYWNGKYYLYYSSSYFGTNYAVCGLAIADNIEGPWTDIGLVTDENYPIDPDIIWDGNTPYLVWGSWTGPDIYIQEVDTATGKLAANSSKTKIASGIEGASMIKNGSYFYLFGSKGKCCDGTNSTYYTVVARSTSITGPFSFTPILTGKGQEIGTGGGDIFDVGDDYYFCYHFYDPNKSGESVLNIRKMAFKSDWPVILSSAGTYPAIYDVSSQQLENPAINILDDYGNNDSRWSAQVYPQWLIIDYGKEKDITGFELWTYQNRAYQFKTTFSNDPEFTAPVAEVDMLDNTSTEMPLSASIDTKSRYVKITVESASGYAGDWISLSGFRLKGTDLLGEDLWYAEKEEKIAEAAGLQIGDSIDLTSIIYNPGFEKNQPDGSQVIPGWTKTGTASSEFCTRNDDGPDNFKTGNVYFQHLSSASPKPDFSISQKITNLPNGIYTLSADAGGNTGTYIYANNSQTEVISEGENYKVSVVVINGELTIGFKSVNRTVSLVYADNFSLTYTAVATDLNSLNEIYIKQKADADSILALQGNPGWYNSSELTSAVNAPVEQTEESLSDAISAIITAIGNYNNIIKRYKPLKDKIAEANVYIQTNYPGAEAYQEAIDEAQAVYDNTTEQTVEDIEAAVAALDAAYVAYYISQPVTEDNPVDFTLVITNPDFEDNQGDFQTTIPGWTRTGVVSGDNFNTRNNDNSIKSGNVYFEHWSANKNDFTLSQKITGLPNGYYKLTAAAGGGTNVYLFANNSQTEITAGARDYTIEVLVTDGTLNIGFKSTGRTVSWVYADNFRLVFYNPTTNIRSEGFNREIFKAFPVDGGIIVTSSKSQTVTIYTITGQMVKTSRTSIGENFISLAKGFYIVNNIKVIVL